MQFFCTSSCVITQQGLRRTLNALDSVHRSNFATSAGLYPAGDVMCSTWESLFYQTGFPPGQHAATYPGHMTHCLHSLFMNVRCDARRTHKPLSELHGALGLHCCLSCACTWIMAVILILVSEDRMVEQTRRPTPVVSHQAGPGEVSAGTLSGMNLRYSAATDRHLLRQTGDQLYPAQTIYQKVFCRLRTSVPPSGSTTGLHGPLGAGWLQSETS